MITFGPIVRTKKLLEALGKPLYLLLITLLTFLFRVIATPFGWILSEKADFNAEYCVRRKQSQTFFHSRRKNKPIIIFPRPRRLRWRIAFPSIHFSLPRPHPPKKLTVFICIIFLLSSTLGWISFWVYTQVLKDLPTVRDLRLHRPQLTTKIYDRNGVLLYNIYKNEHRSLIALPDIATYAKDATISIEDKDFFTHKGISLRGIGRSVSKLIQTGRVQGGSTITQQLVKNTLLSPERTLRRKMREILVSLSVEHTMSKEEILQSYFNEVSYGGSIYGIEEAAQSYFGKSAKYLDLAESAFLAGLPAAPTIYSPFGPYPERGIERQHEVLRRMVEDKKISLLQAENAKAQNMHFITKSFDIRAPHFVMYVKDLLVKKFGEDLVSAGGLEVYTTLDYQLQEKVQNIVKTEVLSLKKLRVGNGAAMVTNPKTGEILAMVGSQNYFDSAHDGQVNVVLRPRQPGSSIKPLMYSAAFERGLTPATIIPDSPITFAIAGSKPYSPQNYDGRYHGNVRIRTALASSYNIPAVKVLNEIGVGTFIQKARQLGITTWEDQARYGLSLTLGGGEVYMTDMLTAYSTFANGGDTVPLEPFVYIKSSKGQLIYQNPCIDTPTPCGGRRTLDPRIAYQITNILIDNQARSPAFGSNSVLMFKNNQVAVKTGTTNGLRDNWTFGYTTNRMVGVWVGNNDNTPMSRVTSGITGASPIWRKIIDTQLHKDSPHIFPIPEGLATIAICARGGMTICGQPCQATFTEYFLPGTQPSTTDTCTPDPNAMVSKIDMR